ncbi:ROK family transcriptional regulator [Caldimonas brevitalea]|uniref:N-acylmannosamine kinase n=1 Tax=Caldimonas brevitalea TaxID=413882 RepID=A0A0G3BL22_9BURK|nr:ROK family transcriptional regulator [Caldimonas brevitalea]AKJ28683.1 N-acylmannosamine kinase [Caldimonas brevitalea]
MLLQRLRRAGVASKADLARWAQLTHTAVGSIVQALEEAGLVESVGRRQDGQRGQPAGLYRLNPDGAFGVGVRLDRTSIETVLVDLSGKILARQAHDRLLPHPDQALDIVRRDVASVLDLLGPAERGRLAGVGLAQPYHLGSWLRELDLQGDFRIWNEVDFGTALSRAVRLPVFKENDGTAAGIAELFFGAGRAIDDFLYLFIGPAIGGAAVVDGEALRGHTGNAADVAMLPVPPSRLASAPRTELAWDVLLTRASLNALTRHLRYHGVRVAGRADLAACFERGDAAALEWLDDSVDALVPALRSALAVLDVPVCVIDADVDGGLIDALISRLEAGLRAIAPESCLTPRLQRGSFGADAGALGAASLPMFFNFSPRADVLRGHGPKSPEVADA